MCLNSFVGPQEIHWPQNILFCCQHIVTYWHQYNSIKCDQEHKKMGICERSMLAFPSSGRALLLPLFKLLQYKLVQCRVCNACLAPARNHYMIYLSRKKNIPTWQPHATYVGHIEGRAHIYLQIVPLFLCSVSLYLSRLWPSLLMITLENANKTIITVEPNMNSGSEFIVLFPGV